MEFPVFIGGRRKGTLRERVSGLYTVFEAELPGAPEELVRLWVHGEGEIAYLGVPLPREDGLFLSRRLSALERAAFPRRIECASDEKESLHNTKSAEQGVSAAENESTKSLHNITTTPESPLDRCPWPAPIGEKSEDLLWLRRQDGSLTTHDGVSCLLALPCTLRAVPRGAVLRRIEDRDYLVFRY